MKNSIDLISQLLEILQLLHLYCNRNSIIQTLATTIRISCHLTFVFCNRHHIDSKVSKIQKLDPNIAKLSQSCRDMIFFGCSILGLGGKIRSGQLTMADTIEKKEVCLTQKYPNLLEVPDSSVFHAGHKYAIYFEFEATILLKFDFHFSSRFYKVFYL